MLKMKIHKNKSIQIYIIKYQNNMDLIKCQSMNIIAPQNLPNKLNCLKTINNYNWESQENILFREYEKLIA